jgi:hypothetical protein
MEADARARDLLEAIVRNESVMFARALNAYLDSYMQEWTHRNAAYIAEQIASELKKRV